MSDDLSYRCYECDDEIIDSNNSILKEAVAHVLKHMGAHRHVQSRPNSSENVSEASAPTSLVSKVGGGAISKTGPKLKVGEFATTIARHDFL